MYIGTVSNVLTIYEVFMNIKCSAKFDAQSPWARLLHVVLTIRTGLAITVRMVMNQL